MKRQCQNVTLKLIIIKVCGEVETKKFEGFLAKKNAITNVWTLLQVLPNFQQWHV